MYCVSVFMHTAVCLTIHLSLSVCLSTVKFPHLFSHLLDVHVIVGDDQQLQLLMAALEKEVTKHEMTVWKELAWFQQEW